MTSSSDLWFGTSGPRNAQIAVVGEAWGSEEERRQLPFVGESGRELDKMLAEAGIDRSQVFCTNLVSERPPSNELFRFFSPTKEARARKEPPVNGLYPHPRVLTGMDRVKRQLAIVRPRLIIACGNYPLWLFSSEASVGNSTNPSGWKVPTGISTWRGSQLVSDRTLSGVPLLPVLHPAFIIRNWKTRPITVHDLRTRAPLALGGRWSRPGGRTYIVPPSFSDCLQFLDKLDFQLSRSPTPIVVDLETRSSRVITCVGLLWDGTSAISIPFLKIGFENGARSILNYWSFNEAKTLVRRLRRVLNHPNAQLIGQNFLYDIQYLARWWKVVPRVHFDTMLAQHVLFPGTPKPLWYLASLYCNDYYSFWKEDSKEWEGAEDEAGLTKHLTYNCDDLFYTWKVWKAQEGALHRLGVRDQFNFKLQEWALAFEMMERGVLIDQKIRSEMVFQVSDAAASRIASLNRMVHPAFRPEVSKSAKPWYSSAIQQMRLFYENLGLKAVHHKKTGNLTADDTALVEIALRYPELTRLVDTIADLRSLGVFQNNFLAAPLDPDGRMRCSFNVAGPETFRWSSSENAFGRGTNLQNIPKGISRK